MACCLTSWTECPLQRVIEYNHDTSIFVFRTSTDEPLKLSACGCLLLDSGDAIRPYTPIAESHQFDRIVGLDKSCSPGEFALLVKRYREWGYKPEGDFDTPSFKASYRPAGTVSNYIHGRPGTVRLKLGDLKAQYPFDGDRINMIAVGAGIAPMIQALHPLLFEGDGQQKTPIVLFYGNRSVDDILLRETLEEWTGRFQRLTVVHCVGSRYANINFGLKKKVKNGWSTTYEDLQAPPVPPKFEQLPESSNQKKEIGWVSEKHLRKHAFPPNPTTLTFVCGLPAVYDSICGPRLDPHISQNSALGRIGYQSDRVIKL